MDEDGDERVEETDGQTDRRTGGTLTGKKDPPATRSSASAAQKQRRVCSQFVLMTDGTSPSVLVSPVRRGRLDPENKPRPLRGSAQATFVTVNRSVHPWRAPVAAAAALSC